MSLPSSLQSILTQLDAQLKRTSDNGAKFILLNQVLTELERKRVVVEAWEQAADGTPAPFGYGYTAEALTKAIRQVCGIKIALQSEVRRKLAVTLAAPSFAQTAFFAARQLPHVLMAAVIVIGGAYATGFASVL
ncbi:MAG TPA: hypothetical protein VGU45_02025 [Microvirga sp.]|jgi:hypothetical protein|nr:hypothetical protein [Microvirga sp.]